MKKKLVVAAVLSLALWIAAAADPPQMKEGLWSIHRQTTDNPGNRKNESSSTICRSHAYDDHVRSLSKERKGCTTNTGSLQGGKYSTEVHCVVAGTTIDTKGSSTFTGDTEAHSESHTTYSPAFGGISESTDIMDQKYIGSCPAGVQPGDLTTSTGQVNHLWKH